MQRCVVSSHLYPLRGHGGPEGAIQPLESAPAAPGLHNSLPLQYRLSAQSSSFEHGSRGVGVWEAFVGADSGRILPRVGENSSRLTSANPMMTNHPEREGMAQLLFVTGLLLLIRAPMLGPGRAQCQNYKVSA